MNNRKILNGFYAMLGLTEKSGDIMRTVDKLDKIGPEKVKAILTGDLAVTPSDADEILKFIAISGGNDAVLSALEGYRGRNEIFDQGLEELNTVVRYLADFGVPAENFAVDLTIARGLDYYTGTVYETTMLDHPEIGSICSGGGMTTWRSTTRTGSSPARHLHRPDPALLRAGGTGHAEPGPAHCPGGRADPAP